MHVLLSHRKDNWIRPPRLSCEPSTSLTLIIPGFTWKLTGLYPDSAMRAARVPEYFMACQTRCHNESRCRNRHPLISSATRIVGVDLETMIDMIEKWTVDVYASIDVSTVGGPGRGM